MSEEMIDIIDENDNVIDRKTRSEVREKALPFRAVRIIIKNSAGRILIQKRSLKKDFYPGIWELGVAGTVTSGESYEATATRELEEEEGIIAKISFLFDFSLRTDIDKANYRVYECVFDGKLNPQASEVERAEFVTLDKLKEMIGREAFTPPSIITFKRYLEVKGVK